MADRNTIFMLDDIDEDELGGFNDAPEWTPDDDDQADTETHEIDDEQAEPVEGDERPEEQPTEDPSPGQDADPEPEPEKEKPKAKPKPEQRHESNSFDVNTAIATVAKLTEQNNKLMEQLNKQNEQPADQPAPPEKPVFSQDQWDDDPQGCSEALFEYHEQKRAYDGQVQEQEQQATAAQQQEQLKSSHNESWALSVDIMPELKGNEKARRAWAAVFNNPEAGFNKDPNGPLKATQVLRRYMAEKNLSFDGPKSKEEPVTPAADPAEATRKGAEDEAARQSRVRRQAMHTGGKGGKSTINLTPEQKSVCRQMNISEQAYADSLAALGGGK